jgi:hypothetical protein
MMKAKGHINLDHFPKEARLAFSVFTVHLPHFGRALFFMNDFHHTYIKLEECL